MKSKYHKTFQKYFPSNAVDLAFDIWQHHGFIFKITKERNSKLGDYRYTYATKKHMITINHNLNPYAFLLTYLHEVAHLEVHIQHQNNVAPHGTEWKNAFKRLFDMSMEVNAWDEKLLPPLLKYMKNPKASSSADMTLIKALKTFDSDHDESTYLSDLKTGDIFDFRGRKFRKIEKLRTRSLCEELDTGRRYYIHEIAEVTVLNMRDGI